MRNAFFKCKLPHQAFPRGVSFYPRAPGGSWRSCGSRRSTTRSLGTAPWRTEPPWWPTAWSTGTINCGIEPGSIAASTAWRTQRLRLRPFMGSRKALKAHQRPWGRLRTGTAKPLWTLTISCRPRSSENSAWFYSGQEPFRKSYRASQSYRKK